MMFKRTILNLCFISLLVSPVYGNVPPAPMPNAIDAWFKKHELGSVVEWAGFVDQTLLGSSVVKYLLAPVLAVGLHKFGNYIFDESFDQSYILASSEPRGVWNKILYPHKFVHRPVENYLDYNAADLEKIQTYQDSNLANAKADKPLLSALFSGPPGVGKTKLARLIAGDYHYDLISGSSLVKFDQDKGLQKLEGLVKKLKTVSGDGHKRLLIIDEAEYLLGDRERVNYKVHSLITMFLSLIESGANQNFAIIAITNNPESLDPAILRRLPVKIQLGLPDATVSSKILERYLASFIKKNAQQGKMIVDPELQDLAQFAPLGEGMSAAEIESVASYVKSAAESADRIDVELVNFCFEQIRPTKAK